MKNMKRLFCLLFSIMFLLNSSLVAQAHEKEEHNKQMRDALFKACFQDMSFYRHFNKNEAEAAIHALECAAYLAIDQFNGSGAGDLETLKDYGVKGLPHSISDIDFQSNQYHRKYTHRGWDAENGTYIGPDVDRWITRKQIMLNTAEKVFGSKLNRAQKNSFCAIIYYIHLLGDRESGDKYYENVIVMELGGRTDKQDIIQELIKHINVLFPFSWKRMKLISILENYNIKVSDLMKDEKGADRKIEGEYFVQYKKYASEILIEHLPDYLPKMLKDEQFFSDVFY